MLAKGYSTAELPRLARAAHFWAELNRRAEFEAPDSPCLSTENRRGGAR